MARVDAALILLLAWCFAYTSAIYYPCTRDSLDSCLKSLDGLDHNTDHDVKCRGLGSVKNCLNSIESSCNEPGEGHEEVWKDGQAELEEIEREMEDCPDADGGMMMMAMVGNFRGVPETTKKPMGHESAYECNWDDFGVCTKPLETMAMDTNNDHMEMCKVWWKARECLKAIHEACELSNRQDILTALESTHFSMEQSMGYCEDHEQHDGAAWSEPEPDDTCSWKLFQECSVHTDEATRAYDTEKICYLYREAMGCFGQMHNCIDHTLSTTVQQAKEGVEMALRSRCDGVHHDESPNAWSEPESGEHKEGSGEYKNDDHHEMECTQDNYNECTNPLHTMEEEFGNDVEKMCWIWWSTKVCYSKMYLNCPHQGSVKNQIEGTWGHMEGVMSYCNHFAQCTEEERHECGHDLKEAHNMQDKCRAAGEAKRCLHDLDSECKDDYVKMMIHWESLPWVNKMVENCMYGNDHGSGSLSGDGPVWGQHAGAATISHFSSALSLLTLLTAMVVKVMTNRI